MIENMKTILVVDDKANVRKLLQDYLTEQGFKVTTATNGREAIYEARRSRPDLILLDIMMPGIDGFEVVRRLKADPVTCAIPIVTVTALDDDGARARLAAAT